MSHLDARSIANRREQCSNQSIVIGDVDRRHP
jgi:hypothetical protein